MTGSIIDFDQQVLGRGRFACCAAVSLANASPPRRAAIETAKVMANANVAAIERKPSKFASAISSKTSAASAIGENTESVIEITAARLALAALVSATVSRA